MSSSARRQLSFYGPRYEYLIEPILEHVQQIDLKQILEWGSVTDDLVQRLDPAVTHRRLG